MTLHGIEFTFSESAWEEVYDQLSYIMSYLFVDCPFDMYWWGRGMGVSGHESGDNIVIYFRFTVASDYQDSGEYTVKVNGKNYAVTSFATSSFSQVAAGKVTIDLKTSGNTQKAGQSLNSLR